MSSKSLRSQENFVAVHNRAGNLRLDCFMHDCYVVPQCSRAAERRVAMLANPLQIFVGKVNFDLVAVRLLLIRMKLVVVTEQRLLRIEYKDT